MFVKWFKDGESIDKSQRYTIESDEDSRDMITNYLKIALRNIARNKSHSAINIFGLAVGLACTILILLWVQDELSFDRFHHNADNLFRIVFHWQQENGELVTMTNTPAPLAETIQAEVPEILHAARWSKDARDPLIVGENAFYEDGISSIDPVFLEMFSFKLITGNRTTAFPDRRSVVITETIARKYFGEDDPIDKIINWNNWQLYTVRGVIEDVPVQSHIQFDFLRTFEIEKGSWPQGFTWTNFNRHTYVQLVDHANIQEVNRKITSVLKENNSWAAEQSGLQLILQPLVDIHLEAGIGSEYADVRDVKYVYIYSVIALFILFIACINFMNLSTARSAGRAKEVGLRKTVGAYRRQIAVQFLGESVLLAVLASLMAVGIVELLLPAYNSLTGKELSLNFFDLTNIISLGAIVLFTGILAGSYPALYLSSFNPITALKDNIKKRSGRIYFRRVLVVFQFSTSIILILATVIVFRQLNYINEKALGFDKENVVYIPIKDQVWERYDLFKEQLLTHSDISSVTLRLLLPFETYSNVGISWNDVYLDYGGEYVQVGYDYFQTLDMNLLEGRVFTKEYTLDAENVIVVNQELVNNLGIKNPLGETIVLGDDFPMTIIGIVENAYLKSLHQSIEPQVYSLLTNLGGNDINLNGKILIRLKPGHATEALSAIQREWNNINPTYPLEISFLDETYNRLYHSERQVRTIFSYFALLAIIISVFGLFGLSAYLIEQRTKEIGIRKVLGASASSLVLLVSKEYIFLVTVSNVIAWPIAYLMMRRWLDTFAYRVEIGMMVFLAAGLLTLLATFSTVSMQSIRAALANPTGALRSE